jgi:hypothetical protein
LVEQDALLAKSQLDVVVAAVGTGDSSKDRRRKGRDSKMKLHKKTRAEPAA